MKNRPFINQLVKLLLLLQISSLGVYCDEVKVVRIRIPYSDNYLDANFNGNVYFGPSNSGGCQKWIMKGTNLESKFYNLATGQVLALDSNNQAKTQKNDF